MSFTSKGTSEILVAGEQDKMFVIDVNKGEVTKQVRLILSRPSPPHPELYRITSIIACWPVNLNPEP